jgi:drug/metabolite transporter (DMT)-like permease
VISPIGATGAAVPVAVGLVAGDRPGLLAALGIPTVLIGIVLAARRPATHAGRRTNGIGWALAAAALFGTFLTTYAGAAAESLSWGAAVVPRRPRRDHRDRRADPAGTGAGPARNAGLTLVPGLLLTLGTFVLGEATRTGLLSVVSVIATLNPVDGHLALVLLRERPAPLQRTGAALALVGIVLLAGA